ncbi:MAG: restriction endonuclease subunit S, partial [Proteobacteria bacterium]|nr:restriction endonuclease subunit S [Pseudomonadota bacterium]
AKLPIFDRKGWKRLPFDAFADSVNVRIEPANAAEEIYVGLEHLNPQDLHIRRWGKGSDVIGTKLRFRKGDIIFGRRRAYQRKLAIAEFDGICSAHAMVVRAKPDVVLPEFLPFLMMSDRFMNRAVEISVGSLSPTINWTTLKLEEFALPPLDQQRRMAGILWTVDEMLGALLQLNDTTAMVLSSYANELWGEKHLQRIRLADLCIKVQDGTHFSPKSTTGPFRYLTSKNIRDGYLDLSDCGYISKEEHVGIYRRADLRRGDVLLTKDGANTGNCTSFNLDEEVSLLSSVAFIRTNPDRLNAAYLAAYLRSEFGWSEIRRQMKGTAITRITLKQIRDIPIPVLDLTKQQVASERLAEFETLKKAINDDCLVLQTFLRALLLTFMEMP